MIDCSILYYYGCAWLLVDMTICVAMHVVVHVVVRVVLYVVVHGAALAAFVHSRDWPRRHWAPYTVLACCIAEEEKEDPRIQSLTAAVQKLEVRGSSGGGTWGARGQCVSDMHEANNVYTWVAILARATSWYAWCTWKAWSTSLHRWCDSSAARNLCNCAQLATTEPSG